MKKLFYFLFILSFLGSCKERPEATIPSPEVSVTDVINISAEEAMVLKSSEADILFLDVRTPEEISEGKINDALEIDVLQDSFIEKIEQLDKSQPYVVYCRSGRRSEQAADIMKNAGFRNLRNMEGGYTAWQKLQQ